LQEKLLGTQFFPEALKPLLPEFLQSSVPGNGGQSIDITAIQESELVDILNSRFEPNRKSRISAIFWEPDFLPFAFLELGVKRGAAVCRLVQNFSKEKFKEISEAIQQLENPEQNIIFASDDITEVFSFYEKGQEFIYNFFKGFESRPSKALQQDDKVKKILPIPTGTGFLVGSSYLLTNHHVLPNSEAAKECLAQFGYDQDIFGRKVEPVEYRLDADFLFVTNKKLDYTLVKLKNRPQDIELHILGRAGDRFGWIPLNDDRKNIAPNISAEKLRELRSQYEIKIPENQDLQGEPVNIIQHPKGKRKQVILSSNRVIEIYENFLRYQADADFSSSGSPVFNQQWQLVGLHHAAVAKPSPKTGVAIPPDSKTRFEIVAEQGVRTCKIVADLKEQAESYRKTGKAEIDKIFILYWLRSACESDFYFCYK
jgi:S1-C subfamily serine protease